MASPDIETIRKSVETAKASLVAAAEQIVWQVEHEVWIALGYETWDEMREAEYGGVAFIVPRGERRELVQRLSDAGLKQQQIADTAGITERTVRRDMGPDKCPVDEPDAPPTTQQREVTPPPKAQSREPVNQIDFVNDVCLWLRTLAHSPEAKRLLPREREHLLGVLNDTITTIQEVSA